MCVRAVADRTLLFPQLIMADASSNHVPVLFSFSVFSRPASVPLGSGYELLVQKFLSIYGPQIDVHRKFLIQVFSEEWGQYVDLPKGFAVAEKCRLRLIPLQTDVRRFILFSSALFCSLSLSHPPQWVCVRVRVFVFVYKHCGFKECATGSLHSYRRARVCVCLFIYSLGQ